MEKYNQTRPATLRDVAQKTGVSTMTVSNALNQRGGVSQETKQRILDAARELNYSPNRVAQSLRNARTRTIGVVMADSSQYVFSKLLRGVEHAASDMDYSILLANTDQKRGAERQAIELLVSKRIDGLLLAAPLAVDTADIEWLKSLGVPFVFLMRIIGDTQIDYVANDNFMGGYTSVRHLYDIGERKFCFIALGSSSGFERMRGCARFLAEKDISIDTCPRADVPPQIDDGYRAMKQFINSGFTNGAVCCGCDMLAVGALKAIFEAGLSVPRDLRIIGYDDFDMAAHLRVPLSTIRQPVHQIGVEGLRLLINRIDNPAAPYDSVILQPELIIRESTAPILQL